MFSKGFKFAIGFSVGTVVAGVAQIYLAKGVRALINKIEVTDISE